MDMTVSVEWFNNGCIILYLMSCQLRYLWFLSWQVFHICQLKKKAHGDEGLTLHSLPLLCGTSYWFCISVKQLSCQITLMLNREFKRKTQFWAHFSHHLQTQVKNRLNTYTVGPVKLNSSQQVALERSSAAPNICGHTIK